MSSTSQFYKIRDFTIYLLYEALKSLNVSKYYWQFLAFKWLVHGSASYLLEIWSIWRLWLAGLPCRILPGESFNWTLINCSPWLLVVHTCISFSWIELEGLLSVQSIHFKVLLRPQPGLKYEGNSRLKRPLSWTCTLWPVNCTFQTPKDS